MKTKTINITMSMVCLALSLALSPNAQAAGITLNDPNVVGTVASGEPSSIADEVAYINYLLGLDASSGPVVHDGHTYQTSDTEYNGSVTADGASKLEADISKGVPNPNFTLTGSGYDYVIAKYDGENAGSVVYYFGGAEFTLSATSADIWVNGQNNGYGISHWTGFNSSDTTTAPDGGATLALLGFALVGVDFLRRKLSRA